MKISIVVSVYNEEKVLKDFYQESMHILTTCKWDYEYIFVNDGSSDNSLQILNDFAEKNPAVKVVSFSRNFGHEAAMIAGIDYSQGDGIICMDADLQHPVELIPDIIEKFENGYEIICMERLENKSAGILKNITSTIFYKVLNMISSIEFQRNASDFFAIQRNVASILKKEYREKMRFLRGYIQSVGFKKGSIKYIAKERRAGESKYSLKKLFKFAINALVSFSDLPLKIGGLAGIFSAMLGLTLAIYTIFSKIIYGTPAGYATIIILLCFMFSILFLLLGIIGEYIGVIFAEVKQRPIYIVKEVKNIEVE